MHNDNLIVGSGISGATIARLLADRGEQVRIIDSRPHVGGNAYDSKEHGIMVHKYGPHIFHTNDSTVWRFLSRWTKWMPYQHKVLGLIDGQFVPIPFNLNSLSRLFPSLMASKLEIKLIDRYGLNAKVPILELRESGDGDLLHLSRYIYDKVFLNYTQKQWGLSPTEVDPAVSGRVPVNISLDDRYFQDRYQGIPIEGYSAMLKKMLDHPNITVSLSTPYDHSIEYSRLFWTGSIDEFFGYQFGELPYRSINIDFITLEKSEFQQVATINYPNNYDFTRITEYKHFLGEQSDVTIISCEYPTDFIEGENERQYPINTSLSMEIYNKYLKVAKNLPNIYFLGRLGGYKYCNMDQAVTDAMRLVDGLNL